MENESLLKRCDELLALLYANQDHAKLRALVDDIESLRDRLRDQESARAGGSAAGAPEPSK